jgi:transposase-like protein
MTKLKRGRYTVEFKQEAARLVESGQSQAAAARNLGVVEQTLGNWVKAHLARTRITYDILRTFDLSRSLGGWYKQEERDL